MFFAPTDSIFSQPNIINGKIIYTAFRWCINLNFEILPLMTGFVDEDHTFSVYTYIYFREIKITLKILFFIIFENTFSAILLFCKDALNWWIQFIFKRQVLCHTCRWPNWRRVTWILLGNAFFLSDIFASPYPFVMGWYQFYFLSFVRE